MTHLSDVDRLDEAHQMKKKAATGNEATQTPSRNRFNNFTQRSYDYDELEQMLLQTSAQQ